MKSSNVDDMNTPAYLERVKRIVMENLRHIGGPPSVQMQGTYLFLFIYIILRMLTLLFFIDRPSMPIDELMDDPNRDEDEDDPDDRRPRRLLDSRIQPDGELSDSEDEGDGRRDHASHRGRGHSSDSDNKLKFGMGVGILASSSANTHGVGPSGHTTAVRVLSSSAAAEEMSTEAPEGDMDLDVEDTPPSVQENGVKTHTVNGRSGATPSPSPPKEEKGSEKEADDMILDDTPANLEPSESKSSTPPPPDAAAVSV